jgi:hypothetical protein
VLTSDVILRIIAALLEAQVIILQKARDEQVQSWLSWNMKKIERFERLLDKIFPDLDGKPDVKMESK